MANVELPQLGESVTEGIITAWLVEVGDTVEVDQPIVEISTDKVDTEIPSPVAGTVQELKAGVDDTIEVGQVIAVIGEGDAAGSGGEGDATSGGQEEATSGDTEDADEQADAGDGQDTPQHGDSGRGEGDGGAQPAAASSSAEQAPTSSSTGQAGGTTGGTLTSPLVRKLLREAGLDTADVKATGPGGRITREDAERAIAAGGEASQAQAPAASAAGTVTPPPAVQAVAASTERPEPSPTQVDFGGERSVTQELSRVRKAIAKGMQESLQSTAQLTAAVEVDMTAIMNLRTAIKDDFKAREGVSLSPLPFICRAVTMTIPRHPTVNSSMDLESGTGTFHRYVNLGMAVDTDRGLLVPNMKDAQDLTVAGLARAIADIANRTRNKKIQPDEITGATFTVTNTGSRGTLFDTPILNPPEVAILAACAIEKRPVVISDAYGDSIAIRWMTYLCMTYDHRMLDGADAARFLQDLKWVLEHHDFRPELGL
jgi:pyruvate dehydrogenase E2 component (dihydrolipoamide acetyltransferase)